MESSKAERVFYVLLVLIVLAGASGLLILISQTQSRELAIFELLAFIISITAVALTVLGAISNVHQARISSHIASELRQAMKELHGIDKDNSLIKRRINQEYELAKDIAEALKEVGLIDSDDDRHAVAKNVERKVRARIQK